MPEGTGCGQALLALYLLDRDFFFQMQALKVSLNPNQ
jgi:hypothetical protein